MVASENNHNYANFNFGPDQVLPASSFKTSEPDGAVQIFMTESGPSSVKPISVYTMFKRTAEEFPDRLALMVKRNNLYRQWTYQEYFQESCTVAKALITLGLERFHGVCIMGFNSPEWVMANFGCIFGGGLSAGVYTTNSPEAFLVVAENCRAQIIFVEDEVCLNKFLAVKRFLPDVKAVIQWAGVPGAPGVLSWAELLAVGMHTPEEVLQKRLSLSAVNQCCSLIYTSGTTGPPKGVMLSQDHLTWGASLYKDILGQKVGEEVVLSYLPLSHLAAQMADLYCSFCGATTLFFAPPDALKGSLGQALHEVQPTGFFGVPRVWEKIYEKMQEVAAESGYVKKSVGNWAKYHGLNYYEALREGRDLSTVELMKNSAAKKLILNKVKRAIGFDRAHILISGSAPISTEILEYFLSLDIPIMEGYGLSETLSICSLNQVKTGCFKLGSVGKVLSHTEVKLVKTDELRKGEGEVCMKGRNICMGYLKMPDKTNETIDDDGWLHSGDLGWIDSEGFLFITGRLKELVITAGGENISPVNIEEAVKKELPCLSNAMLIGDRRKYLTILLTLKSDIDIDTGLPLDELTPSCISWMRDVGSQASTVKEALQEIKNEPKGLLATAIDEGILRYNNYHAVSNAQKVQRWAFLPHDFSLPTEELNNTLKLKRSFVLEKYSDIIEEMYPENPIKLVSKL